MAGASPITNGGISNLMAMPAYLNAYNTCLLSLFGWFGNKRITATKNNSTAIVSAIGH